MSRTTPMWSPARSRECNQTLELHVLAPDLRGFGQSDKYEADAEEIYSANGQARAVAALMDEVGLKNAVVAGYDVGGAVSQMLAARRPDLVRALVVSPHLPGAGKRVLELGPVKEFWYTSFHQLDLARQLIDGNRDAVRVSSSLLVTLVRAELYRR
jgi:pimeloyl-ACP methyl ester carboxylesterase